MTARLIETDADIAEGCAWLAGACPAMARALEATGRPPLRRRPGGFAQMLRIICGQQLSVAAADSVWSRLRAAGADDPDRLRAMDDARLRACGLSRPKIAYARALAGADIDFAGLSRLPEAEAVERLTAVKGIGVWTAEIYLMFCVGRADVFAPGDLALQEAARRLLSLPERPTPAALRARAAAWSPWRAVAARVLWSYYRVETSRAGIVE